MLGEILDATRRRLPAIVARRDALRAAAEHRPAPPAFAAGLATPGLAVIAEVKRRSPSRGDLAPRLDPVDQATAYATGGASAISVLTEPEYFSGSLDDLTAVVGAVQVPVLRKDFVLHEAQVWEAASEGASAVLLIVAALTDDELSVLLAAADEARLSALVEVHTDDEARRAVASGASVIGVNNRNLGDFTVDLATAERIVGLLDGAAVTVAESGIFDGNDAARMNAAGFDAVLVGEALVRAADPAALVRELRGATR